MLLKFEPAPLVLGFVLGPLMEENLRRAMLLSRGDPMVFLQRPISAALTITTVVLLVWAVWAQVRGRKRFASVAAPDDGAAESAR